MFFFFFFFLSDNVLLLETTFGSQSFLKNHYLTSVSYKKYFMILILIKIINLYATVRNSYVHIEVDYCNVRKQHGINYIHYVIRIYVFISMNKTDTLNYFIGIFQRNL